MSIYRGSVKAETLYYGGQKIRRVYAGSTLVFDTFSVRTWRNCVADYYILRGKLYYTSGSSAVQVGAYDDWIDVGLRANGTLWYLNGATATQIGNDSGWTDIFGMKRARKDGKLYTISNGTATQVGNYSDYDTLFNVLFARRANTLYNAQTGEPVNETSGITGNWRMGSICETGIGVGICNGILYSAYSSSPVDDNGTWTDIDGTASYKHIDDILGGMPLTFALGIRDGDVFAIGASSRYSTTVTKLDQSGNWKAVAGLYGESYDGRIRGYAYALKTTGALYCLGWNGSASTLTQVGSSTNWKHIFGCDALGTYSAFAGSNDNKLYKLNSNTATLIG